MRIIQGIQNAGSKTAVAIGYFDGVHRGHLEVLKQMTQQAKSLYLTTTVLTFAFGKERPKNKGERDLLSLEERVRLFGALGIDLVMILPFEEIAEMQAKEFVSKVLSRDALNAAIVCCGENFRFGAGRASGVAELQRCGGPHGIRLISVPEILEDGAPISSTRIKQLISAGDVQAAEKLIGRPYALHLPVVQGSGYSVTMGFPTICQPLPCVVEPKHGVYLSSAYINARWMKSITNIGVRPTIYRGGPVCAETHVPGLARFGGKALSVRLHRFLREEKQFAGRQELKRQVAEDVESLGRYVI